MHAGLMSKLLRVRRVGHRGHAWIWGPGLGLELASSSDPPSMHEVQNESGMT